MKGGYTSYAIDFHLSHLGGGTVDESFYNCKKNLINEYADKLPQLGWIQTTCARIYIKSRLVVLAILIAALVAFVMWLSSGTTAS